MKFHPPAPLKQEVKVVFVSAESYKTSASLQEILNHLFLSLSHTKYMTGRKKTIKGIFCCFTAWGDFVKVAQAKIYSFFLCKKKHLSKVCLMGTKVNRLKCRTNRLSLLLMFNTETISVSNGLVLPLIEAGTKNTIWQRSHKTFKKLKPDKEGKENAGAASGG